MKKLLIISLTSVALMACNGSKPEENMPVVDTFGPLRTTIAQDLDNSSAVAVSIAIYKEGDVVFAEAFGEKVEGGGVTPSSNTLFQLGSITKMFTGVATLQMVERGLLSIDDKLVNTLPNMSYPAEQALTWQDINIEHLMTHQSGLNDTYDGSEGETPLLNYMISAYPQQNKQMNPPGIFHNYSNPNWSYLGAIVEYLSDEPYAQYMQENVFERLGMPRTTMDRTQVIADGDYALGFVVQGQEEYALSDINQINVENTVIPAGSETWSTPTELLKMAEFLLNGNAAILSDQWRTEMTKAHVDTEVAGLPFNYGYGIYIKDGFIDSDDQFYDTDIWEHGGNTSAYTSMFWILPEKNVAISIMSSGGFTNFDKSMLAAIEAVTQLPAPEAEPTDPIDPSQYAKHEGVYTTDEGLTIRVTANDNDLVITMDELDLAGIPYDSKLIPMGGNSFLSVIANEVIVVTFIPATEGGESVYYRTRISVGIKDGYSS